jgi:hypothetical protein
MSASIECAAASIECADDDGVGEENWESSLSTNESSSRDQPGDGKVNPYDDDKAQSPPPPPPPPPPELFMLNKLPKTSNPSSIAALPPKPAKLALDAAPRHDAESKHGGDGSGIMSIEHEPDSPPKMVSAPLLYALPLLPKSAAHPPAPPPTDPNMEEDVVGAMAVVSYP